MTANKKSLAIITGFVFLAAAIVGLVLFSSPKEPEPPVKPPAVQPSTPTQSQPDVAVLENRKRTAAAATLSMLESYAAANNGAYPTTAEALRSAVDTYGKTIASSTTVVYKPSYDPADAPKTTDMFYYPGYGCTGSDPKPSSPRSVAVRYVLSDGTYACTSN